jgi:hypothetical protein
VWSPERSRVAMSSHMDENTVTGQTPSPEFQ